MKEKQQQHYVKEVSLKLHRYAPMYIYICIYVRQRERICKGNDTVACEADTTATPLGVILRLLQTESAALRCVGS